MVKYKKTNIGLIVLKLEFLQVAFNLHFLQTTYIDTNPLFVMRSMLGKNLPSAAKSDIAWTQ